MNSKRNGSKQRKVNVRAWTHEEARRAVPYIASVMGSLRDLWIEAKIQDRKAHQLAAQPGRADRTRLLAQAEVARQSQDTRERLEAIEEELQTLEVFCIDPIRGEGVIPFVQDNQLAWFVYDHFDAEPLQFWRFHNDPLEKRRPISETLAPLEVGSERVGSAE